MSIDGESPELKKMHEFLRAALYFFLLLEIVVFLHFDYGKNMNIIVQRIGGIAFYRNIFYAKLFLLAIIIFTCIGTRAEKKLELKPIRDIAIPLFSGFLLFFGSAFFVGVQTITSLTFFDYVYMATACSGTILLNVGFDNISKFVQHNLMKDRFNIENESFEQTQKLVTTPYSVNIPMSYYYKKRRHKGWINIVNPFRGTLIVGTPGSGKSYTFVNAYIRQLAAKGFCLAVYDFKFPDLGKLTYYEFLKNKQAGVLPKQAKFYVINFSEVEKFVWPARRRGSMRRHR
jgi:hypothetical protein